MKRIIIITALGAFLLIVALFGSYLYIKRDVIRADIKELVEERISSLLNTHVRIGTVKIGFLKYITLAKLHFDTEISESFFSIVDIKSIIFKYNLLNFIRRNLDAPNIIYLEGPRVKLNNVGFPHALLPVSVSQKSLGLSFEVRNGELLFDFEALPEPIQLKHIDGIVKPEAKDTLAVQFSALAAGAMRGTVNAEGVIGKNADDQVIRVMLNNISPESIHYSFFDSINGEFEIYNNRIIVKKSILIIRGIPFEVTGTIESYRSNPLLNLSFIMQKKDAEFAFHVTGRLNNEGTPLALDGSMVVGSREYAFNGDLVASATGFQLRDVVSSNGYLVAGDVNIVENSFKVILTKDNQRIETALLRNKKGIVFEMTLNHVSFLGYDLVSVASVTLEPDLSFWKNDRFAFHGKIKTDYFIFNYLPLEDFEGTFLFSPEKIKKIDCHWGKAYSLKGSVSLEEPQTVELDLIINELDLNRMQSEGMFSLGQDISGSVDGKISFSGPIQKPLIRGHLGAGKGNFRQLDFSSVTIQFAGNRELLRLFDSKIYRSGATFKLKGDIDFSQQNIFNNVVIESDDKIILWRGWDLSKTSDDETFYIKRNLAENLDLKLQGSLTGEAADGAVDETSQVDVEYTLKNNQSISVSYEEGENDDFLGVKHKIKF